MRGAVVTAGHDEGWLCHFRQQPGHVGTHDVSVQLAITIEELGVGVGIKHYMSPRTAEILKCVLGKQLVNLPCLRPSHAGYRHKGLQVLLMCCFWTSRTEFEITVP